MTKPKKSASGGIRLVSDIMDRCKYDDITGCYIWAGCVGQGSARANYGGNNIPVPGLLYPLRYNEKVPAGSRYHAYCGNNLCMKHRRLVSLSEGGAAASPAVDRFKYRMAVRSTKLKGSKISQEAVDKIRNAGKGNVESTARELGIALGTARSIACGGSRAPIAVPSVFSWRP